MKKVIYASIAAAMLTACSNDEVVLENNDANAIRFGVTTENNSRAADVFCNANMPEAFNVSAVYNGATYFNGDEVTYDKATSKWNIQGGTRYWPNEGKVSFYGYVNGAITLNGSNAPTFENFKVVGDTNDEKNTVANQADLLYAVKTQAKSTGTQVDLNFRHALSQIVFNAQNDNAKLYVEIEGVTVANVNNQGTYTFPTADTDNNLGHPDATENENGYNRGTWSNKSGQASYNVSFAAAELAQANGLVDLTTYEHTGKDAGFANAMLLLPQTTTATVAKEGQKLNLKEGTHFLVKCRIWNIAGEEVDKANDVLLWGEKKDGEFIAKDVVLPVGFNWEEGKKYTYTFKFGKGNGGYNPDPDPENPDPDPVLVPITFEVQVDEFIDVKPSTEIETFKPDPADNDGENTENA